MKKMPSEKEELKKGNLTRRNALAALGGLTGFGLLAPSTGAAATGSSASPEERKVHYFDSLVTAQKSKLIRPGEMIETGGFYSFGDGGAARYLTSENQDPDLQNKGGSFQLQKGVTAVLAGTDKVNYRMFGARGDGKYDDGAAIQKAHHFANLHSLPVEVMTGDYRIEQTREIEIKTPVNWGQTRFYINEAFNTRKAVFVISGYESPANLGENPFLKKALIDKLKPGVQQIKALNTYSNCLIWVRDNNDRIGHRYGASFSGQSRGREELFYVENDGRIVGDIAWTFTNLTDIMAFPAESSYLVVEGGSFFMSGGIPGKGKKGYFHNGILVKRSRTIIRNQWVGLEKGRSDTSLHPRSGFYYFTNVYDTALENIRLIPWEYDRPGTENDGHSGTYGIGGNRMMNTTFRNVTAEGTRMHWGVFGTNMNKNFRVENCRLNRIDVHFHCWNLSIKDSQIGNKGITLTGGGELHIENTRCDNTRFVNFRRDFGAKWDGNIVIKNCRLRPDSIAETSILYFVAANFDYGYPIGMAKTIYIDNFIVDYSTVPDNHHDCWIIRSSSFSVTTQGKRSFFPEYITIKNVFTQGRTKGIRIMKINNPAGYALPGKGFYDGAFFEANALLHFNNIGLEKINGTESSGYHLQLEKAETDAEFDAFSLYPRIDIKNCPSCSLNLGDGPMELHLENSTVNLVETSTRASFPGELSFTSCKFVPGFNEEGATTYQVASQLGTSFINCTVHLPLQPKHNGASFPTDYGFMQINRRVKYNHLNTRLGKDILNALNIKKIKLKSHFIAMLKNHHELE